MLKSALLMAAGVAIGFGASAVLAQNSTPYFQIAEINVVDQKGYEASGVVELRDAIKASGAKLIGGGYNKAVLMDGSTGGPVPNRSPDLDVSEQGGSRQSMGREHQALAGQGGGSQASRAAGDRRSRSGDEVTRRRADCGLLADL